MENCLLPPKMPTQSKLQEQHQKEYPPKPVQKQNFSKNKKKNVYACTQNKNQTKHPKCQFSSTICLVYKAQRNELSHCPCLKAQQNTQEAGPTPWRTPPPRPPSTTNVPSNHTPGEVQHTNVTTVPRHNVPAKNATCVGSPNLSKPSKAQRAWHGRTERLRERKKREGWCECPKGQRGKEENHESCRRPPAPAKRPATADGGGTYRGNTVW